MRRQIITKRANKNYKFKTKRELIFVNKTTITLVIWKYFF
jgi:hypothetical protein